MGTKCVSKTLSFPEYFPPVAPLHNICFLWRGWSYGSGEASLFGLSREPQAKDLIEGQGLSFPVSLLNSVH